MSAPEKTTTQTQSNTDRQQLEARVREFMSSASIPDADKFTAAVMNAFSARLAKVGRNGEDTDG